MIIVNNKIENDYEQAKQKYNELGINTDKILDQLKIIPLSIHCWQADDVCGFEKAGAQLTGGGIQVTGNCPGKARNVEELLQDFEKILSLVPGTHRVNLHAIYGDFRGKIVDRNEISTEYFQRWINWAKEKDIKIDFNPSLFSHPKADHGFTLSDKSKKIREFWVEHVKKCREISAEIGKQLNDPCIHNIWIPDGMKDIPIDRAGFRALLKESLDDIFSIKFSPSYLRDSLEGKLFGIGSEAFVVGSHDFYLSYAISNHKMLTIDTGHYHPTESIGDKISAILPFIEGIVLHVSRGIRWDSDHVVILNDDLIQLTEEIVRNPDREKVHICTDWFDGSINRIGGYVLGCRAILKGLLYALLQPLDLLKEYEVNKQYFERLALLEELKTLPFGSVWNYYCLKNEVPVEGEWNKEVDKYEKKVLSKRI